MADNKPTVPAPPWTLEVLGPEKYEELHRAYYGGAPDWTCPYDLDLTTPFNNQGKPASRPTQAEKE